MNKNIKEPSFDLPAVYPIAESNDIIVVQQLKESYDEDYKCENNFSQQYCNSSFDNSQHCNVIVKLNDKDDYIVNTCKPIVSVVKLFGEGGSPSSTQILEYHTATVAIANGIKELVGRSYCTTAITPLTTTTSTTITTTHNEMVQEHEEFATSNVSQTHDLFDNDLITCTEFSSDHTSNDQNDYNYCDTPISEVTTLQPSEYCKSTTTNYRVEEFGMATLQIINILLCMLLRHFLWKDMFSSMSIMQRASKDQYSSSHVRKSEAIVFYSKDLYFNILLSYEAGWIKIISLWNYLLDKVNLYHSSIQFFKCYLYKNICRTYSVVHSEIISCEDVHYMKELPQAVVAISKQYWLSIINFTITGLSLWLLNVFEISNAKKSISTVLRIEEDGLCDYHSNITLDARLKYDHYFNTIFFIIWSMVLTNCINGFVTMPLSSPAIFDVDGELTHTKKGFMHVVVSETSFALEFTHWLCTPKSSLLLNNYKYGTQFRISYLHQNAYKSFLSKVLHSWCDNNIIAAFYCNPYTTSCGAWPSTGDRELLVSAWDSSYARMQYNEVHASAICHYVLSIAVIIITAFVLLFILRNNFSIFPILQSVIKFLIVDLVSAVTNNTYKLFDSIQHFCDGMYCTYLRLKRNIASVYSSKSSCAYESPPHDIDDTLLPCSTLYDSFIDNIPTTTTAAADATATTDDTLVACQEENGLVQVLKNVPHFETSEHSCSNSELVVVSTMGCVWPKDEQHNGTTSYQLSNIVCSNISVPSDDNPSCIPLCDDNSIEVVSPYECVEFVFERHNQAEYRNADHAFVCNESNIVTDSIFPFLSPIEREYQTNHNCGEFKCFFDEFDHKYMCTQNCIKETETKNDVINDLPPQEETDLSESDSENGKSCLPDDDDDSDCDDDVKYNDSYEKSNTVTESQSCDGGNNELIIYTKPSCTSCCDADGGKLLIGANTIRTAYGGGHCVWSVIGHVIEVYTYFDTDRPVGGDHVNKPNVSNNQPSAFEGTASVFNADQQTAPPTAPNFFSVASTEQRRQQSITSAVSSHVERDGALRDNVFITPEGYSMATQVATAYPTTMGAQLEKPTQSQQMLSASPRYHTLADTKFEENAPLSYEEVKQSFKSKTTFQQHEVEDKQQQALKQTTVRNDQHFNPQITNQKEASNVTAIKPKGLPKRSCVVVGNTQYPLTANLLAHPHMDHFFVKERKEIKPGHFLAKLVLQHHYLIIQNDNAEGNETATAAQQSQAAAIVADSAAVEKDGAVTKRQHFPMNINRTGYIVFSSDLTRFKGDIKYPLPSRKATGVKIGKGGNGFVFSIFHVGKEYAVKKTVYRPNEIRVHSQLAHINLVNLEAVLIGEEHEHHKTKFYAFYFMNKLDMDFRSVISTKEHGCLKHLKLQLSDQRDVWEVVMVNVKYVLRSLLKALDYMHNQGLVHRDVKASNILLKMNCQCTKPLMCACPQKCSVKLGDFDSSTNVPGHGLKIEPHQMIRYASVLPLGTMGYRAPEVSMHLVISGPYEVLYTTGVDIWSFGCLLLNVLIGKCGPLKQRGEASLLLSVQEQPYSEHLYNKIIKVKELQKYYSDIPELIDLVRKCLQVKVHCRPTAKQLLQLDVLQCL